ncbi:MAG: Xaa-Pro peptidase family protein [Treponema sp.]|nr:Xaa-Pro peptidase family protein [Treponema sp.]
MRIPSTEEMKKIYADRRIKIADFMKNSGTGAAIFIDKEEHREPAIRYLTGHPSDAVLLIFDDAYSVLIPWDVNLAKKESFCDKMIPYTKYGNSALEAVKTNLNTNSHFQNKKVELPPSTPYPEFLKYVDILSDCDVRCHENGVHEHLVYSRMIKDDYEIACTKEAARIGDIIIDDIEEKITTGGIKTETDAALLIEQVCRENGCERTGFDTLAAGPSRSWAIHCFPNYTAAKWPDNGLSILDFGVVYNGYTSDTTVTVVKGKITPEQEKLVNLVQKAADDCLKLYKPETPVHDAAAKADTLFAAAKRKMPHTLGHAIGLEIHEQPHISTKMPPNLLFQPGMIVTLEPGLYDPELGGCRLENDVLITKTGNEVITHSRIIRIP